MCTIFTLLLPIVLQRIKLVRQSIISKWKKGRDTVLDGEVNNSPLYSTLESLHPRGGGGGGQ